MIHEYSIKSGAAGTRQTLRSMKTLSRFGCNHAIVRQAALQIPIDQFDGYLRQIWDFVPEFEETLITIDRQVNYFLQSGRMQGDCDDAAIVAGAFCLAKLLPQAHNAARFVAVRPPASADFQHVFTEWDAPMPGRIIRIDPTAPLNANYTGWERMIEPLL